MPHQELPAKIEVLLHRLGEFRMNHPGVHMLVVLAEQGLFLAPPRSIVGDNDRLRIDYYAWQVEQRAANRPMFERLDVSSWKELRLHFETMGNLCRAMVYQRSVVVEFERRGWGATNICVALRQCGLGEDSVERIFG
jgi:hypothetical protein